MIMVMISQITIGENRNKTARSISASSIIRNAYLLVFFFFRLLDEIFTGGCYLPSYLPVSDRGHIEKKRKKKTLICDINVSTTY